MSMDESLLTSDEGERVLLTMDDAFKLSGGFGRFQIQRVLTTGVIFTSLAIFIYSLPFFEHATISCTTREGNPVHCNLEDPCKEHSTLRFKYTNQITIVEDFDLLCEQAFIGWIGTAFMIGYMFSSYLFGYLSEVIGRRYSLVIAQICCMTGSVIFMVARENSEWLLIFGGGIIGIGTGTFGPSYNLAFDVSGSPHIHLINGFLNSIFSLMEIMIAVFMYLNYGWRIQMYALVGWYFFCMLLLLIFISEGPRYLVIKKNNEKKIIQEFKKIAKCNGKEEIFPQNVQLSTGDQTDRKQMTFWAMFKFKTPRNRFLLMCPQFFITICVYYGVSLGMAKVGGSIELNTLLGGIFEMIAYISSSYFVNTKLFGRKYTLLTFYILAGLGFIFQIILEAVGSPEYCITIMVILRKFGISGCFMLIILFSSELFSSEVRSSAMGALHAIGGIGGIFAPMIVDIVPHSEYFFAGGCVIASLLLLPLPETRGKVLEDIMTISDHIPEEAHSISMIKPVQNIQKDILI